MTIWIIVWILFWFSVMGVPLYLFKKHKITLYENSWQHTLFYISALVILLIVYRYSFSVYFANLPNSFLLGILSLFLFWILAPFAYQNDYYTRKERFKYQLPKFFEIVFQQLCFLGGLLTFGFPPLVFGLVFFIFHIPGIFFLPKKFVFFPIFGSLAGGLIFAYLQSMGVSGFVSSLALHLLFWIVLSYVFSKNHFSGTAIKR